MGPRFLIGFDRTVFDRKVVGLAVAAASVVDLVAMEVGGRMLAAYFSAIAGAGSGASVAVVGMKVVIDMAVEVSGAVKPWAGTDEDSAGEPFRAVVAVGGAAVGSGFVVAVGAARGRADVDADLALCRFG
jgi:hypothetical protein